MGWLGLDPEYSILDPYTNRAKSAHHLIGDETLQQYEIGGDHPDFVGVRDTGQMNGAEVSRDGAALEVRSKVRSSCRDNIIPYVAEAMRMTQFELDKKFPDYVLSSAPKFILEDVIGAPADVTEFGCNPDFNAYTLQVQNPILEKDDLRRYTGGHIHVSYWPFAKNNKEQQAALTLLMDVFIGLPFVAMLGDHYADGEAERRETYGKAGSFRYDNTSGKLEYRTPSGRMLLSPLYLGWALGMIRTMSRSYGGLATGGIGNDDATFDAKDVVQKLNAVVDLGEVRRAINEHDVATAEVLYPVAFEALPNWSQKKESLNNSNTGGGGADYHPYFFKTVVDAFVAANHANVTFKDDMQFNWGLYEDYRPTHHKYWGIHTAMVGGIDDLIFPQRPFAMNLVPESYRENTAYFTHPTVGGARKWVGSPGWLA